MDEEYHPTNTYAFYSINTLRSPQLTKNQNNLPETEQRDQTEPSREFVELFRGGRVHHCAWMYGNHIYLIGGKPAHMEGSSYVRSMEAPSKAQDISNKIIKYDILANSCQLLSVKADFKRADIKQICNPGKGGQSKDYLSNLFETSAAACCLNGGDVYFYGGSHNLTLEDNDLLTKLNLQTGAITTVQYRGEAPGRREQATLIQYAPNWLLLAGGFSYSNMKAYNDFYFFSVEKAYWYRASSKADALLIPRINGSMCFNSFKKKVYLFGGYFIDCNNHRKYLRDLIEFTIEDPEKGSQECAKGKRFRPKVQGCELYSSIHPQAREGHKIQCLNSQYLILHGGEVRNDSLTEKSQNFEPMDEGLDAGNQSIKYFQDIWIYDLRRKQWSKVPPEDEQYVVARSYFSLIRSQALETKSSDIEKVKFYVFGGLSQIEDGIDSIQQLTITVTEMDSIGCLNCFQPRRIPLPSFGEMTCEMVDDFLFSAMPYSFHAFGLIFSNSVNNFARRCNISYIQNEGKYIINRNGLNPEYKIEDDSESPYTHEELYKHLYEDGFSCFNYEEANTREKRLKQLAERQRNLVQYCANIKLAGLRLGNKVVWSTITSDNICVVYYIGYKLRDKARTPNAALSQYRTIFFAFDMKTDQLLPGYTRKDKDEVECMVGKYINRNFVKKKLRTLLIVSDLKTIEVFDKGKLCVHSELSPNLRTDICIYEYELIAQMTKNDRSKHERSIDMSLEAYVSSLFLSCPTRFFSKDYYSRELFEIKQSKGLHQIDKLVAQNSVVELNSDILKEFECKIVELYYCKPQTLKNIRVAKKQHYDSESLEKLEKSDQFYPNGVLIYHRGKLLKRYKYPLGAIQKLRRTKYVPGSKQQQGHYEEHFCYDFFGFIELPEKLELNIFQTDLLQPQLLENLEAKLREIEQICHRKYTPNAHSDQSNKQNVQKSVI